MRAADDFSVLYGRWMPTLTRYCRGILRSEADAEDAAQNAMVKAMGALSSGPAPRQMTPWLHRIARNEAISLLRRREGGVALQDFDDHAGPSLEEVVATRRRLAELLEDLQSLPERQREALVLREVDGLSHRRIAEELGISEGAAQQAVLDARRSLHAFKAGRALACDRVQTWLSAHEHARLRTRGVRAHLRGCDGCRAFSTGLRTRPRDLAALLPGGVGGAGLVARLLSLLGGAGAGAKSLVAAGLLATGGLGVIVAEGGREAPVPKAKAAVVAAAPAPAPARNVAATPPVVHRTGATSRASRAGAAGSHATTRHRSAKGHAPAPAGGAGSGGTSSTAPSASAAATTHTPTGSHTTPAAARDEPSASPATTTSSDPVPVSTPAPLAPVVDAVEQTTTTAVQTVTKVIQDVTSSDPVAPVKHTVDETVSSLLGGG